MYADDVILFSFSYAGLQSNLDILQTCCEDFLFYRQNKSGYFNKAGRLINSQSYITGRIAQSVTCLATDASLTADPGVAS